ncbi:MAG: hypothetical protein J6R32_10800 [Bacteroidales bacterium]|nr:hypothetical protein [Bacteroidales bacterium]
MIKIITICGSMRFADEMEKEANRLTILGYNVKLPIKNGRDKYTDFELEVIHRKKIATSDAILVMNIDGYIGESTRKEIEFAEYAGKVIFYKEEQSNEC